MDPRFLIRLDRNRGTKYCLEFLIKKKSCQAIIAFGQNSICLKLNNFIQYLCVGSQPGGHDGAERPCGRLPVRRSRFAAYRAAEPGDAIAGVQLPLPRAEARGDRGLGGLHSAGVEDAAEPAQDLGAKRLSAEPRRSAGGQR